MTSRASIVVLVVGLTLAVFARADRTFSGGGNAITFSDGGGRTCSPPPCQITPDKACSIAYGDCSIGGEACATFPNAPQCVSPTPEPGVDICATTVTTDASGCSGTWTRCVQVTPGNCRCTTSTWSNCP